MDILSKVVTAIKGGLTEASEAIVVSQAVRISEQEIREAEEEMNQSKDFLASMVARQKISEDKANNLQLQIDEFEGYAVKAHANDDEILAKDMAAKICVLESRLASEHEAREGFADSANALRVAIAKTEKDVKHMKAQLDPVEATEYVRRAEAAISEQHSDSNRELSAEVESSEAMVEKSEAR